MNICIHEGINVNYRYYLFGRFRREKVVLSCHKHRSYHIITDSIYRIEINLIIVLEQTAEYQSF